MTVFELVNQLTQCDPLAEVRLDSIFREDHRGAPMRVVIDGHNTVYLRDYYIQQGGDIVLVVAGVEYELIRG